MPSSRRSMVLSSLSSRPRKPFDDVSPGRAVGRRAINRPDVCQQNKAGGADVAYQLPQLTHSRRKHRIWSSVFRRAPSGRGARGTAEGLGLKERAPIRCGREGNRSSAGWLSASRRGGIVAASGGPMSCDLLTKGRSVASPVTEIKLATPEPSARTVTTELLLY
ncbi:hypothetical protein EVAR_64255_1 [Eumeta japonica]|uniref:Uncharacterized protein n=1 Tax=Eumeta variegata TaxID=151549 RepID=A0A4C1YXQ3_EUMVA|nr:hypothetical protein EVAR_64255_1 [Eumeta japonica]